MVRVFYVTYTQTSTHRPMSAVRAMFDVITDNHLVRPVGRVCVFVRDNFRTRWLLT